jgi:aminoglycoside phosphotransferase (APT) family kinase protein
MADAALFEALPETVVAQALLSYLRTNVGAAMVAFAAPPVRMLGGFDTLVYAFELRDAPPLLDGPLVLRIYRDAQGPMRAEREGCVQNALAALGFPTPRVLLTCVDRSVLGGAFLIMQRLRGRVMLDAFFGPRILRMPALLAELQVRLHELDPLAFAHRLAAARCPSQLPSVNSELAALQTRIADAQLDGLASARAWVGAHRPPPAVQSVICHGDFHPLNILLDGRGVSGVLDWAGAKVADPMWDVGATVALLTQGPLALPALLHRPATTVRRWLAERYLTSYAARRPLDRNAVRYYEAVRCLGMLLEAGEHIQARRGIVAPIAKPTAFSDERTIDGLIARLADLTGLRVSLPTQRI